VYTIVGYWPTAGSYLTWSFAYVYVDERWCEKCLFESEKSERKLEIKRQRKD